MLGTIGAAAFGLAEDGVRAWTGIAYGPTLDEPFAATAAIGTVLGLLAGATGLRGARFGAFFTALFCGVVAAGPACWSVASDGGFAAWPLPVMLIVVAAVAYMPARALPSPRPLLGFATGGLAFTAVLAVTGEHLVAGPGTPGMLVVGGCAAGAGFALGALATALAGSAGPLHVAGAWLVVALLGGGLAALKGGPRPLPVASADASPPIVVIAIDGLRADALSALGGERIAPNLDRLAARGVLFANASTTAPWAMPAAASAFTGVLPHDHGAMGPRVGLRGDVPTVFERLATSGTRNVAFVGGRDWSASYGLDRGFATWDEGPTTTRAALEPFAAMGVLPWVSERDAAATTDRAITWIAAQTHSQWCVLVRYGEPIGPLATDDPKATWSNYVATVDVAVGRLVEALPKGTRIVLFGTHGVELGQTRSQANRPPPGVRYGHSMYEEIIHVPLIVAGTGRSGKVVSNVSVVDIGPTLAKLGGVTLDSPDSLDLLGKIPENRLIMAEAMRFGDEHKLTRRTHFKYVTSAAGGALWDLNTDPHEIAVLTGLSGTDRDVEISLKSDVPPFAPLETAVPMDAVLRDLALRIGRRPPPPW